MKLPARGHPALPPPADLDWARAAKLEGRIVRRAHLFLDEQSYLPYALKQQEMTAEALELVPRADHLKRLDARIRERVGASPVPRPGPVHDLVALTGVLRLMTSALPRADLPGLLVATQVLLEAYDDMLGVRRSARTVISLFEQRLPLLFVLSHLLDRPSLLPDADPKRLIHNMPAVRAPLLHVLQAVVDNRHARKPRTLDRILEAEGEEFSAPLGFHGAAMLYGLGRILLAHGTFAGRATRTAAPPPPLRASARRRPADPSPG